jgi:hypothetical protein
MFHVRTGEPLSEREYQEHVQEALPSAEDRRLLLEILGSEKKWITPRTGARDPLETIGEPRKQAMTAPVIN